MSLPQGELDQGLVHPSLLGLLSKRPHYSDLQRSHPHLTVQVVDLLEATGEHLLVLLFLLGHDMEVVGQLLVLILLDLYFGVTCSLFLSHSYCLVVQEILLDLYEGLHSLQPESAYHTLHFVSESLYILIQDIWVVVGLHLVLYDLLLFLIFSLISLFEGFWRIIH